MTIKLLVAIQGAGGVEIPAGTEVTLTDAVEAAHVSANKAVYTTRPMTFDALPSSGVGVVVDPVTGVIKLPASVDGFLLGTDSSKTQNYMTKAGVIATNYNTPTGTTVAGTGATLTTDTTIKIDGLDSGKFVVGSASPASVLRTDGTVDSDGQVCVSVYIPDYSVINQISIKIGDPGFANSYSYSYQVSLNTNNQYNGLHRIYIDKSKWGVLAGSPVWGTTVFSRLMVEVSATTGVNATVYIGTMKKSGASKSNIIWTWDDGYYEMYSAVHAYAKTKNFPMTFYVIGGSGYGYDSDRLTVAQMEEMYDYGHDIANHAFNHTDQVTLGDADYVIDKERMARWLEARGFTRRGMNYHHAYVQGVYSATTAALLDHAGFLTARTISSSRHMPTWNGVANRLVLDGGLQLNSTLTLAQAKAKVDAAITHGGTLVITGHRVQGSAGSIHWATADFQALVDYIAAYRDAGSCNIKCMSEWYAGLTGRPV